MTCSPSCAITVIITLLYFWDLEIIILKPLLRWHIGNVSKNGFECLKMSIESFLGRFDADGVICHNNLTDEQIKTLEPLGIRLIDQRPFGDAAEVKPRGVAWKLYPARLALNRHELVIDNDLLLNERIESIDHFLENDCTLLLEGISRAYGRFERHVPINYKISSGLYGMPPGFNFGKIVDSFLYQDWEENAMGIHLQNFTFDEQGLVALGLLSYPQKVIIPITDINECQYKLTAAKGHHFVALNKMKNHGPFRLYKSGLKKMHL